LFEPIKNDKKNNPINLFKKIAQHRKEVVLLTMFDENKSAAQQGTCCLVNEEESFLQLMLIGQSLIDESRKCTSSKNFYCGRITQMVPYCINLFHLPYN